MEMQLLLDSSSKLNLLCNQATFEFSRALLSAAEAKTALLESTALAPSAGPTSKPLVEDQKSSQISALDKCAEVDISTSSKDQPKEDHLPDKAKVASSSGKAQMTELFESLAAIRSNLQSKQRSQTKLGDLVAKTTAKVTSILPSGSTLNNPSSFATSAPYPSLFSQKMGSKAFPTLSKLDSRPSFKPTSSALPSESLASSSTKTQAAQKNSEDAELLKKIEKPDKEKEKEVPNVDKQNRNEKTHVENESGAPPSHRPAAAPSESTEPIPGIPAVQTQNESAPKSALANHLQNALNSHHSPDPLTVTAKKEALQEEEVDEVSMELDTPPMEGSSEMDVLVSQPEVPDDAVLGNVYRGNATSFLDTSSKPQQSAPVPKTGVIGSSKPVHTFLPVVTTVKEPQRAKPVIHALKAAEMAAKKEKEEKEKRLKEKEARKLQAMEKKKEHGANPVSSSTGPLKRPYPTSHDDVPKKKVAHVVSLQQKSTHQAPTTNSSVKLKLPVAEIKAKAPLLSHSSVSSQHGVKNPMLPPSFTQKPMVPKIQQLQQSSMPGPSTIVDTKTGEIMGLNQDASSDSEASPAVTQKKPPVPVWAQSPQLRQALYNQKKVNPDEIFSGMEAPNLKEILGNAGKMSMGLFEVMEELSTQEQEEYRRAMGFK